MYVNCIMHVIYIIVFSLNNLSPFIKYCIHLWWFHIFRSAIILLFFQKPFSSGKVISRRQVCLFISVIIRFLKLLVCVIEKGII